MAQFIKDYLVVTDTDYGSFSSGVLPWIKVGWTPLGGVSISTFLNPVEYERYKSPFASGSIVSYFPLTQTRFAQAMVLYEELELREVVAIGDIHI